VLGNHSCLFLALKYLLRETRGDPACRMWRTYCADVVEGNPETYTDLRLEMPRGEYRRWIEDPSSWAGELEVIILAAKWNVEVAVTSAESVRTLVYNVGASGGRINLLYTGQHFDPLVGRDRRGDEVRVFHCGDLIILIRLFNLTPAKHLMSCDDNNNFPALPTHRTSTSVTFGRRTRPIYCSEAMMPPHALQANAPRHALPNAAGRCSAALFLHVA